MMGITEVIENLYISGLESATTILNRGIRSVINISSECPVQYLGPTVDYEKISIQDSPNASIQVYFDRLTDRIEQNLQQGKKTLVHCYVGRSRSATIILAYLMRYQQMSLREAYDYLLSRRPIIGPNFGFMKQLIKYEKSLYGYKSIGMVDTPIGSVPDVYLTPSSSSQRRRTTPVPIEITGNALNRTMSLSRPTSSIDRSFRGTMPSRTPTFNVGYMHSPSASYRRPVDHLPTYTDDYVNSSFLHDPPGRLYVSSAMSKPYESLREPYYRARMSPLRAEAYAPSVFNRFYLP